MYRHPKSNIGLFDADEIEPGYEELEEVGEIIGADIRYIQDEHIPNGGEHAVYVNDAYMTATAIINFLDKGFPAEILPWLSLKEPVEQVLEVNNVNIFEISMTDHGWEPGFTIEPGDYRSGHISP